MLKELGYESLDALISYTVPGSIQNDDLSGVPSPLSEYQLVQRLRALASKNDAFVSYIGTGYHDTITPAVIARNVLENPGWYTQYTPYQAEISQGRLEALLNFQTAVIDLTGLPLANASLLDEGTAAAEAMSILMRQSGDRRHVFLVDQGCHPQTIAVVQTRSQPLGVDVRVVDFADALPDSSVLGLLLAYPTTDGEVRDLAPVIEAAHRVGAGAAVVAELLSLTLLTPPGEMGADIAIGSAQTLGIPLGFGGPHPAYFAAKDEFKRVIPGRIIGISRDASGKSALRMALQTREQHIRRERATSNICTSQVLLAVMASMYAVYHGPEGLQRIGARIHHLTRILAAGLRRNGHDVLTGHYFDTLRVQPAGQSVTESLRRAESARINLRDFGDGTLGVSLDETVEPEDLLVLLRVFGQQHVPQSSDEGLLDELADELEGPDALFENVRRESSFLEHPVFNSYHSETEMLRYIRRLEGRDLSLCTSMIPLGSCTMKLNATTEMLALSWPEFSRVHPFAPLSQVQGYLEVIDELKQWLAAVSGLPAVSLQPNSGAQGEYAGLLVIRAFLASEGMEHRNICLIPSSAHGTNPASAVMAGMKVVVVACDDEGNIDFGDLAEKAERYSKRLAALMITYPSTHGVFEDSVREICDTIHRHGGQVYLDGANLNAQVGICRPGDYGADVCHINLHKTFSIPHGGGGPGMGPICAAKHLADFLPGHPLVRVGGNRAIGPVASAPWGSASILLISWAYIALLGREGLRRASEVAILNANYMAHRLKGHFNILYQGPGGAVAHEFILDLRPFRKSAEVTDEDVAKRLMDYGFHAPTVSFPVAGTIMVEPTESESKEELDRFCDALISIRAEIQQIESGLIDQNDNPLKHAPHTAAAVIAERWSHPYSREQAAFPAPWTKKSKFWPSVGRVDNAFGDRHLVCACPPVESYVETEA
jgi:glycine dehydrogenase